jgi:predicted CXXCH cytochrome family protein
MQGNDFVQSLMYTRGVTCFSCHDPHGSDSVSMLREKGNALCLGCHEPNSPIGPFADSIPAHTHHKLDSTGSQCVSCHMPLIEETLGSVKVHAHTFRFITPAATQELNVPNPCTLCHTDKTVEWAEQNIERLDGAFAVADGKLSHREVRNDPNRVRLAAPPQRRMGDFERSPPPDARSRFMRNFDREARQGWEPGEAAFIIIRFAGLRRDHGDNCSEVSRPQPPEV